MLDEPEPAGPDVPAHDPLTLEFNLYTEVEAPPAEFRAASTAYLEVLASIARGETDPEDETGRTG